MHLRLKIFFTFSKDFGKPLSIFDEMHLCHIRQRKITRHFKRRYAPALKTLKNPQNSVTTEANDFPAKLSLSTHPVSSLPINLLFTSNPI